MPVEKWSWRPSEGVRSFAEVVMHVAAASYIGADALGVAPPAGVDPMQLESVTDKEQAAVAPRGRGRLSRGAGHRRSARR